MKSQEFVVHAAALSALGLLSLVLVQPVPAQAQPKSDSNSPPATQEAAAGKPIGNWGFDISGMDKSVRPGDDFAGFVSGNWMKHTQIPADRSRYGAFDVLRELSDQNVRGLLEEIQRSAATLPMDAGVERADRVKLASLFSSYLDKAEADRKDSTPIQPMLATIRAIAALDDMAEFMGKAHGEFAGGESLFGARIGEDEKRPDYYTVYISQSGLGLPDREYYLSPIYAAQKERYHQYVAQMLEMIGWDDPKGNADKIVELESNLATQHWTRAQNREREKTYNPMTIAELAKLAPDFPWQRFLNAAGVGQTEQVVVAQNTAMPFIARIFRSTPMATLAAWQAFNVADQAAPLLSSRFVDASFEFHGKFMSGAPEQRDRVKRAVTFVDGVMGEAVGREYVARYFPAQAKAQAEALVNDVRTTMRKRIERLEWMSPETKAKALAKMDKIGVKIGYPPKWHDYSMLIVSPNDLVGNATRAERFHYAYRVSKLGQKVDKLEWGMTPQTVNAYYNPSQNEIVFPTAILQPPFFDPSADAAINYGGIGAVIGHEITHAFDDQGRKSDGDGVLTDWWTPADAEKFEAQAKKLGARYEALEFPKLPGSHINGKTTMGENIADLGGILNAIDAYKLHLAGRPAPVIDGFTGDQRVFLGWAQVWRTLSRDAALKQQLATDPHSPGAVRAFAPLRTVDLWYEAFNVQPGDKEYLAPEDRVRIW